MSTPSFNLLSSSWNAMLEHWQFTSLVSFIGSLFAYLIGVENQELLLILLMMIMIDTLLGTIISIKERRFNSKGMGKGVVKVVLYGCFLIMFHLAELTIDGTAGFQVNLIDLIAYLYLIIREAKSSNEKLAKFSIALPINPFEKLERIMNRYAEEFERVGEEPNRRD